jgi:hypothetical protein
MWHTGVEDKPNIVLKHGRVKPKTQAADNILEWEVA